MSHQSKKIESFFKLFQKSCNYIKDLSKNKVKSENINKFVLLLIALWYIQRKGFFNNDPNYFISHLKQIELPLNKESYGEFLTSFFNVIFSIEDNENIKKSTKLHQEDLLIIGEKNISDNYGTQWDIFFQENFPNRAFFQEPSELTRVKVSEASLDPLPIFNMLLLQEKIGGEIDEFTIGALFEKIISEETKKVTGAYYTPENICNFIVEGAMNSILFPDRLDLPFWNNLEKYLKSEENRQIKKEKIQTIFEKIKNIKVLDPAVGSGHFLASFVSFNIRLHEFLWNEAKKHDLKNILIIQISDTREDLVSFKDFKEITAILKNYIFTNVVYGIDINHDAVIITKIWLLLNYIKSWNSSYMDLLHPRHLNFNLFTGNSLIGFGNWDEIAEVVNVKSLNIILLKNKILKMFKSLQKIVNKERLDISIAKIESDQFDTIKFLKNTQFLLQNLGKYITNHPEESRKNGIYQIQKSITIEIRNFYDDLFSGFSRITGQKIEKFGEITPFHWVFEFPEIFPMNINDFGFDVILGNPPYGNLISTTEKKVIEPFYSFLNEISAVFIERAMNLNKIGGLITFLTSYAICFSKDFSNIRKKIAKTYKINRFATFDRDKCRFFTNMTQSVSIIQCINKFPKPLAKNQFSDILTTNMYRKMPDLRDLKYFPVKKFLLGKQIGVTFDQKHRLPKIGYKWLVELLTFISTLYHLNPNKKMLILGDILNSFLIIRNSDAYRKKLIQFEKEGKRKKNLLSIRISGNYWYNAWNEPPYFGSQIALIEITKPYDGLKNFLLILINSSFYYVWFRIYSDGRHMNSDIMKALPLPKDLQKKLRKYCEILKVFSSFLMKKLNYFYDKEYRRFSTSKMKHIIDICDLFLGEIYDMPDEMVEHIQNFEPSIRGGKKISNEFDMRIRNLLKDNRDNKNIEGLIVEFKDILELIENNENLAENK